MDNLRAEIEEIYDALEAKERGKKELLKEAVKGFASGVGQGVFDVLDGATLGGASKADKKYFGGTMNKLNNELEQISDITDIGNVYRGLQDFNKSIGAGLLGIGVKNAGGYGLNEAIKWNGRRDLVRQLERGDNFKDINFGKMDKDTLNGINELRRQGGYDALRSQTYIPANVVRKWHEKRITEGYSPQEVTNIARDLFQKGKGQVTESRYPHIQQIVQPKRNISDVGYVAQNPNNGQTVIKSVYKKDNVNIIRSLQEGRCNPSSVVRGIKNKPAVPAHLSALQQTSDFNITPIRGDVKSVVEEWLEKLRK